LALHFVEQFSVLELARHLAPQESLRSVTHPLIFLGSEFQWLRENREEEN
jgi:hypothetical protein